MLPVENPMRISPKLTGSARVVAWVYTIFGAAAPLSLIGLLGDRAPLHEYVQVLGVHALLLVAGVGILRGWRWAWWLACAVTAFLVLSSVVVALDQPIPGLILAAIFGIPFAGLVVPTRRGTPGAKNVEPGILGGQALPPPPPPHTFEDLSVEQDEAPPRKSDGWDTNDVPERPDRVATAAQPKRSRRKHSVRWWIIAGFLAFVVLASILLGIACEAATTGYSGGCL